MASEDVVEQAHAELIERAKATIAEANMSSTWECSDGYRQFLAEWLVKAAGWRPACPSCATPGGEVPLDGEIADIEGGDRSGA